MNISEISQEQYLAWLFSPNDAPSHLKKYFPGWPSDEVRIDCTGDMPFEETFRNARNFSDFLKETYSRLGSKTLFESAVLDYGCGWGRVTRFLARDVAEGNLVGCDPNPGFIDLCRSSGVNADFFNTDWMSLNHFTDRKFNFIFSYSIFTHTSEELARNILNRYVELAATGAIIILTVRPRSFLEIRNDSEHRSIGEYDVSEALSIYDSGRPFYRIYEAHSPQWGVTIMPPEWIKDNLPHDLEFLDTAASSELTQVPILLRRK